MPQLFADLQIGGKGHPVRQTVNGEISDFNGIGTGPQAATGMTAPEPNPHSGVLRIMKIGMHREYRTDCHLEAGFLFKFTLGCLAHILFPFHMTTGNAPHTGIGPRTPYQKQTIIFHVYYCHTNRWVSVLELTAFLAIKALLVTVDLDLQLPAAVRTEFKLHRPFSV